MSHESAVIDGNERRRQNHAHAIASSKLMHELDKALRRHVGEVNNNAGMTVLNVTSSPSDERAHYVTRFAQDGSKINVTKAELVDHGGLTVSLPDVVSLAYQVDYSNEILTFIDITPEGIAAEICSLSMESENKHIGS